MEEEVDDYRRRYGSYYERQHSKDCLIHSFNNAFGRHAVDKRDVLEYIYTKADAMHDGLCRAGEPRNNVKQRVNEYLDGVMTNNTYFTADVVWGAAQRMGVFKDFYRVPGFAYGTPLPEEGHHQQQQQTGSKRKKAAPAPTLPDWALALPVVVLGSTDTGSNHAVAIRDGSIYDSEIAGSEVAYSAETLSRILPVVHGAFAFR